MNNTKEHVGIQLSDDNDLFLAARAAAEVLSDQISTEYDEQITVAMSPLAPRNILPDTFR